MGAFSDSVTATATSLLTKFGQSGTFTRETEGEYNPLTGDVNPATISTYSGKVLPDEFKFNEVDGTTIKATDSKLYVNNAGTAPKAGDAVAFGGNTYRVVDVQKITAQGADIMYILQVRR